jgi:hypothetical protein
MFGRCFLSKVIAEFFAPVVTEPAVAVIFSTND